MMMKKLSGKKGFTLPEVMLTVALVGAVTAISIPQYQRIHENVETAKSTQLLKQIQLAIQNLYLDHNPNQFPPTSVMPDGLDVWAAPAALQDIDSMKKSLSELCNDGSKGVGPSGKAPLTLAGASGSQNCIYSETSGAFAIEKPIANTSAESELLSEIQKGILNIFAGHTPNQYPPDSVMPDGLVEWVDYANVQDANNVRSSLGKLCNNGLKGVGPSGQTPLKLTDATGDYNCVYDEKNGGVSIEKPM